MSVHRQRRTPRGWLYPTSLVGIGIALGVGLDPLLGGAIALGGIALLASRRNG